MATKTTMLVIIMTIITVALLGCCCSGGAIYKVGDSEGWSPKEDAYYNWAVYNLKEFHVGDSLVFDYDNNINDVTQVSGALEYHFCDSSSPKAVYKTGHDVVTLKEPGYHYFITSNHSQCRLGQKLGILVVRDPSDPIPPPPPPTKILPCGQLYKVGDSKGWSVYDKDYYQKWSDEKEFHVGDTLLFEYDKDFDDVYEIPGHLEFEYCKQDSPVGVYNTGFDLVRLTEPGVHYFMTTQHGHCGAGLKLRVIVQP